MRLFRIPAIATALITMLLLIGSCVATKSSSTDIPYKVAERYFIKNNTGKTPPTVITTEKEFESYFGCAAVMGKNGMPTIIDFDRQYVISVTVPSTDLSTELIPVSLKMYADDKIDFRYRVKTGARQSYTTKPSLLIIVDKKYGDNVTAIRE